jgi:hypothetical protein
MPVPYHTLEQHKQLLQDRGYLDPHFLTATQVGYWLQQFQQQFDQSFQQAHLGDQPERFMMDLWGKFNNYLDKIHYTLRYKYDPALEHLRLFSLHAALGKFSKTFYFDDQQDLPSAQTVYELLAMPQTLKEHQPLFTRLAQEFRLDRDPENDYKELNPSDPDAKRPSKSDLKDYPTRRLRFRTKR